MSDNTFTVFGEGFRAGGTTFREGDKAPVKYRQQLNGERTHDPASVEPGTAPNFGRGVIPHIYMFSGIVSTLSKSYRIADQAYLHNKDNAHMMLNDPVISGPLFARQRMVSLLKWSIEPEDDTDRQQRDAAQVLTKILEKTPRFTEYRRWLSEAIWYGRVGTMNKYGINATRDGHRQFVIRDWVPVSGDKLLFRYDDGSGQYNPDQIGIKVSPAHVKKDYIAGNRDIEWNADGSAVFLKNWERRRVSLHKHMIRDGEYEDPLTSGQIHGVGIRNFIYWVWYQKQETLASLMEIIERTAQGFTLYFYPTGNPAAKAEMEKIAAEQGRTNRITIPVSQELNYEPIQVIPPNTQGITVLREIIDDYFGDMITRFILGQTLSTKSSATGLGSGVADLHHDSLMQIVDYDAINLEETITKEVVEPLRDWNLPRFRNWEFKFKLHTEDQVPQDRMQAAMEFWQMGGKLKADDLYNIVGLSKPQEDDETLFNPQVIQAINQAQQPNIDPTQQPPLPADAVDPQQPPVDDPEQPEAQAPEADKLKKMFGPILNKKSVADIAKEVELNPSEKQIESGNYKKGHVSFQGLSVAIENPKGSKRRPEWPALPYHYGYIKRTVGSDGDQVDVCVGPDEKSEIVFIVDQESKGGRFDEHKCLLGYTNQKSAVEAYKRAYTKGWRVGPVTAMTIEQFKAWVKNGDTTKRVQKQVSKYKKDRYANQLSIFNQPKEGDTRVNRAGNTEILKGGRWHLVGQQQQQSAQQLDIFGEPAPNKPAPKEPAFQQPQTQGDLFDVGRKDLAGQELLFDTDADDFGQSEKPDSEAAPWTGLYGTEQKDSTEDDEEFYDPWDEGSEDAAPIDEGEQETVDGLKSMSNEELVSLAKEGDQDAYTELWKKNQGWLNKRANDWTYGNPELKEDLIQQVGAKLKDAVENFDPSQGNKFLSYLNKYITHQMGNLKKKEGNILTRGWGGGASDDDLDAMSQVEDQSDQGLDYDVSDKINHAMEVLSDREHGVMLQIMQGKSHKQIADELGLGTKQAIQKIATSAKEKLKPLLQDYRYKKPFKQRYRKLHKALFYEKRRAPKGGITIQGKEYPGGQWIPAEVMDQATPEEKAQLEESDTHQAESIADLPNDFCFQHEGTTYQHQGDGQFSADGGDPMSLDQLAEQTGLGEVMESSILDTYNQHAEQWQGAEDHIPDDGKKVNENPEKPAEESNNVDKPKEQPENKPDPHDEIEQQLKNMPAGTNLEGWVKNEPDKVLGISDWRHEETGKHRTDQDLARTTNPDDFKRMIQDRESGQEPEAKPGSGDDGWHETELLSEVSEIAGQLGISLGSKHNRQAVTRFVNRAAREMGHDPQGKTNIERAHSSAKFLETQIPRLQGMVEAAKALGYQPHTTNLVTKAKRSADRLIATAMQGGWAPDKPREEIEHMLLTGNDEAIDEYRQQIVDAIEHLHESDDSGDQSILAAFANAVGGYKNLVLIAGAIAALWFLNSQMMLGRRRYK